MLHAVVVVVLMIQGIVGFLCDLYVLPDEVLFKAQELHRKGKGWEILSWPLYLVGWLLWLFVRLVFYVLPVLLVCVFLQSACEVSTRKPESPVQSRSIHELLSPSLASQDELIRRQSEGTKNRPLPFESLSNLFVAGFEKFEPFPESGDRLFLPVI